MNELHPKTYNHGYLGVSNLHKIWYTESGNPNGIPVLSLHGGPGSKSKPKHLGSFDLNKYRVVQFDQRGCGLSTPQGEIQDNTTPDLIEDIERLRTHLEIDKWVVTGGSWGSTLALLYAQTYPNKVRALSIQSIFLARKKDTDWLLRPEGVSAIFPEVWETRSNILRKAGIDIDVDSSQLLEFLTGPAQERKQAAIEAIEAWEGNIMSLETRFNFPKGEEITEDRFNAAKIFLHYDSNNYFIENNQILNNAKSISNIHTYILHGRYDMVCPLEQAYLLYKAIPNSKLEVTNFDGHSLGQEAKRLGKYMFEELMEQIE